jgi:hypothetical protein
MALPVFQLGYCEGMEGKKSEASSLELKMFDCKQ